MYVDSDSTVTIGTNVTLTGGYANNGGSIYNNGTLDLKGNVVDGYAAKTGADPVAEVNGHGGGIFNAGTVNLNGGYISGDIAEFSGGGIFNDGTVNLNGGYITSNTLGGILNAGGTVTGNFNGNGLPPAKGKWSVVGGVWKQGVVGAKDWSNGPYDIGSN